MKKKSKKIVSWIGLGISIVATIVVVGVVAHKAGYEDAVIDILLDGLAQVAGETFPG